MHARLLDFADQQAPRYTSYPTAPHFSDEVTAATMCEWLGALAPQTQLSLYVHVPYCRDICWYCGCNTHAARRDEPIDAYVRTLLQEIDAVSAAAGCRTTMELHWGGGTPNILSATQFEIIVDRIDARFARREGFRHAIELDPRSLDEAAVAAYARAGVTRASLGVQDVNPHVQAAIGRVQPLATVERAVALLRTASIDELSIDLMYGLPGQTTDDVVRSAQAVAALGPQRVALFGYAHVPWFKRRQRLIDATSLPSAEARFEQAETARAVLEAHGFCSIGLDHFARPDDPLAQAAGAGRLARSFQGYGEDIADAIIGFGPSAISTLPQGYAQNLAEPNAWARAIDTGVLGTTRGHALSADDRRRRAIIDDIMCAFRTDLAAHGGASEWRTALEQIAPMVENGLVRLEGDQLILHPDARPLCRIIAKAFDAYAPRSAARHSNAV